MAIDFENTKKLKPCPICGQKDRVNLWVIDGDKEPNVSCSRCGIDAWTQWNVKEAIRHWNELPRKEELTAHDATERKDDKWIPEVQE